MNARNLFRGGIAGILGGVVFGMMMAMMGTLPMIGKMIGVPNAFAGFVVHLAISAAIGVSFSVLFGSAVRSHLRGLVYGVIYGGVWWLLGPLTLMPLFLGMGFGVNWSGAAASAMLPSLWGHLMFGAILGIGYAWLRLRGTVQAGVGKNRSYAVS